MTKKKDKINTFIVITPDGEPKVFETPDTIEEVLEENFAAHDFDEEEGFIVFNEKDGRTFRPQRAYFREDK
jgi:hypothetical protein